MSKGNINYKYLRRRKSWFRRNLAAIIAIILIIFIIAVCGIIASMKIFNYGFFKSSETQPIPVKTQEETTTAKDVVWIEDKEIVEEKVNMINQRKSPIADKEIEEYLAGKDLNLTAVTDGKSIYGQMDYVIISTPTNYDAQKNYFNTSSVEAVLEDVLASDGEAVIIVKSTVPVGYTEKMRKKYQTDRIIFSPEFLREGRALYDNLYPSRIINGITSENREIREKAERFA